MKKIYSVLAAALAVSVSASAALNLPAPQKLQLPEKVTFSGKTVAPAAVKKAKNVVKVARPIDQIYGPYWTWSAQPYENSDTQTGTLTISPSTTTPGNVVISGFVFGTQLDCPYDAATGEITIKGGMVLQKNVNCGKLPDGSDLIGDLTVQTRKWTVVTDPETGELTGNNPYEVDECKMPFINDYINEETGEVIWSGVFDDRENWNIITLAIYKDGADTGYGIPVNAGYFNTWVPFSERLTQFTNLREILGPNCYFTYNENDWENKGMATMNDGWFTGFGFNGLPGEYEVPALRYKNNPNFVYLLNPYGPESGYQGTFSQEGLMYQPNGGILLDLTDKTLPIVVPCVPSGAGHWQFGMLYMSSMGGHFKYFENVPAENVKAFLEENKFTLPTMDNQFMVTLPNCRVANATNIIMLNQWGQDEMVSQIQLPEGAVVGVEGIVNDADVNAPVRYFNLQGVEVAAPVKGEVVVKKQGSKATKVVF